MGKLIEIIIEYPNLAATIFGVIGTSIGGIVGWFMRRPLERQAVASDAFKTQIIGYESLVKSQGARISYLESQESIRVEYENVLLKRLRECEDRYLRSGGEYDTNR